MLNKLFGKDHQSLLKLNKGYAFDYQNIQWEIIDVYEYDWGQDGSSIEYKILGGSQEAYLEVEDDDGEIVVIFSVDIDKDQLMPDFGPEDFEGEEILAELDYAGRRYQLEEINEGYFKNIAGMEPSQRLTNYGFYDGEHFVAIAQWDDGAMDFSVGQPIDSKKIKNIKAPF